MLLSNNFPDMKGDFMTLKQFNEKTVNLMLETFEVETSYIMDSDEVSSHIVSIDLWGKNHHYIANQYVFYEWGFLVHCWDFEYYDKDDNEPTYYEDDVKIESVEDFKQLVKVHLNSVLNG